MCIQITIVIIKALRRLVSFINIFILQLINEK
ncbi:hypothetical protein BRC2024_QFGIOCBO_CDS_0037 [Acinetobacter phage vB_AbaM_PhT2-v2]